MNENVEVRIYFSKKELDDPQKQNQLFRTLEIKVFRQSGQHLFKKNHLISVKIVDFMMFLNHPRLLYSLPLPGLHGSLEHTWMACNHGENQQPGSQWQGQKGNRAPSKPCYQRIIIWLSAVSLDDFIHMVVFICSNSELSKYKHSSLRGVCKK